MFGSWLNKIINGATKINRWQGKTRLIESNDAEHMWSVAVISEGLARIQEERFGQKVDVALLLRKAIFHDCIEVETGDIPSDVKKKTPAMKKALEEVERICFEEEMKKLIPKTWRKDYKQYILNPKDNANGKGFETIEGKILAAADSIDALNEVVKEVKLGNRAFEIYLPLLVDSLIELDLECSNYFLKYSLVDFELPLIKYGSNLVEFVRKYEFE